MVASTQLPSEMEKLVTQVRDHYDADIVLFFGPVERPKDDRLIDACAEKKRRKNVLLIICTFGGNPHASYRMARTLQKNYRDGEFLAYVFSSCWSAGTLLITGANRLILSDHAELGPIDVQLRKQDEVGEWGSGLTPIQALQYLAQESQTLFQAHFENMRFNRDLLFSTKMASTAAVELTTGLIGRLYEQIDPMRVAEINRALGITSAYGERIRKNLKNGALEQLLMAYPAHDFVIDPIEARQLFERVEAPHASLEKLGEFLKEEADKNLYGKSARVCYLEETISSPPAPSTNENAQQSPNGATPAPQATDAPAGRGVATS